MGTDIHIEVEQYDPDSKTWVYIPPPPSNWSPTYRQWFGERAYWLFALLADVRNGRGFAGVYRGEPITPLSSPRGLPRDVTAGTMNELGDGLHGLTWFTLRELTLADYDVELNQSGLLSLQEYRRVQETKDQPRAWCGDVSGPGIRKIQRFEADDLLSDPSALAASAEDKIYVRYSWTTALRDSIPGEWFAFLERIGKFTLDDGSDVRVLIGFDS